MIEMKDSSSYSYEIRWDPIIVC